MIDETVVTSDGVPLAVRRFAGPAPRAAAIVAHAMMATSDYLVAFAEHLARAGLDVFLLELRGHGGSGRPPGRGGWRFADHVERDLPAALAFARARSPAAARGLGYVGHSLGGLVALGHLGTRPAGAPPPIDRLALVGVSLWRRALAPVPERWRRDAVMAAFGLSALALGRVPARRLRVGTVDEPRGYALELARWYFTSSWRSGAIDYAAALARVRVPVLSVWSEADPLARGRDVAALTERLGAAPESLRVEGLDHFGLLRDARARPAWDRIAEFLLRA